MAQKINSFQFTKSFKKQYKKLPKEIQKAFDQKLQLFLQDISHPSLRTKRIQGTTDRWEGSVTMKYRFTFQFSNNTLIFRAIGSHDIILKES
jgi:mRNA-degrading endonuclease RelE of RelBE toxin-antitoxin system